jgi:chromosome segregation ATPase
VTVVYQLEPKMSSMKWNMLAALACLAAAPAVLTAQEPQPPGYEVHHALAAHHANAAYHARALHHHASTSTTINRQLAQEHAAEIGRSLDAADRHNQSIEGSMSDAERRAGAAHLQSIRDHQAKARERYSALNQELSNAHPDAARVRAHTAYIHQQVTQAQASHQELMRQRRVREMGMPPPQ